MKRMTVKVAAVLVVALGAGLISSSAQAKSLPLTQVKCGDVVTKSIKVANDLSGCDMGLVVGAAGITIDMDGHTFEGTGDKNEYGIGFGKFDDVTLRNGALAGFYNGVDLHATIGSTVKNVVANSNTGFGFRLFGTEKSRLEKVTASYNEYANVLVEGSTKNTITKSLFVGSMDGVWLNNFSTENTVSKNKIFNASIAGIDSIKSFANTMSKNYVASNDNGVRLSGQYTNTVKNNHIHKNVIGINVFGASNLKVKGNKLTENTAYGMFVGDGSNYVTVVKNTVTGNGDHGIYAGGEGSVTFTENKANDNGFKLINGWGHGIHSEMTNTSGSKNVAHGNDGPDQCKPVVIC